jgi:hypothetical protein
MRSQAWNNEVSETVEIVRRACRQRTKKDQRLSITVTLTLTDSYLLDNHAGAMPCLRRSYTQRYTSQSRRR